MAAADRAFYGNDGGATNSIGYAEQPQGLRFPGSLGKAPESQPIQFGTPATARVVRIPVENAGWEEIVAAEDPDTKVITVRIGCQTLPAARWRRVGPALIRRHIHGADDQHRYNVALHDLLATIEMAFA